MQMGGALTSKSGVIMQGLNALELPQARVLLLGDVVNIVLGTTAQLG